MALIYNATFDSQTRILSLLDKAGNVISSCEVQSKINELTLTATADNSSVKLTKRGTVDNTYEVNMGSGWVPYTFDTVINLNNGQSCKWRCTSHPTSFSFKTHVQFVMTGTIEASGNCNSMLSSDFKNLTSLSGYDFAFYNLFNGCAELTKAPELPSTILATSCYHNMFTYCSSLTRAPELPAMTLASECYNSLFFGCSSLAQVPELPATNLAPAPRCYSFMFAECTALTRAPALPATTLVVACYSTMFRGCTSLIQPPELPALKLDRSCYSDMFKNCSALTQAPSLPATTLADYCYIGMFSGCSSLNEVRCKMPSTYTSSQISSYASNWLYNVASTGTFYTNADANWSSGESGIPTGWTRVPAVDDPNKPLMLRSIEDNSSVTLTKNGTMSNTYQTSTNGTDWTNYTLGTKISLNNGESVYFRCRNNVMNQSEKNYVQFVMEGKIEAWHNAYSMIKSSFTNTGDSVGRFGMYRLFQDCKSLTKAPLLVNTVLEENSYSAMFSGCTSLAKAPALPATTLRNYCYSYMFDSCTSLIQAPELPATALAEDCYKCMFMGCTSLTKAPSLPATTLVKRCYEFMFYNCTSLTQAPELPATALINYCYSHMFEGCTSLTKAPVLPATSLADYCYYGMFVGCNSLKEVRIYATNWATGALDEWLSGVSATGDFYCDPNATIFSTGASGIPANWTRHALADYPTT